jgi:protein transport protein SEC24
LGVNKKLREGRDYLSKQISELCTAYRKEIMGAAASTSQLTLCRELCLLPLLLLGILKSVSTKGRLYKEEGGN